MRKFFILSILCLAPMLQLKANSCASGPLKPCEWSFTVRGGIEPGYYPDRRRNDFTNMVAVAEADFILDELKSALVLQVDTERTPKFDDQFNLPWTVVGDLAYALSCNTEIFIDGLYGEGKGKSNDYSLLFPAIPSGLDPVNFPGIKPEESFHIKEKYSDLTYVGGNIGLRYYFPQFCGCGSFFIGAKAGVRHYDPVRVKITAVRNDVAFTEHLHELYYNSYNVYSGGAQLGFDVRVCDCLHFVLMGEVIGTGGLKSHKPSQGFGTIGETVTVSEGVDLTQQYQTTLNIPSRRTCNVLSFPITAGLRLTF